MLPACLHLAAILGISKPFHGPRQGKAPRGLFLLPSLPQASILFPNCSVSKSKQSSPKARAGAAEPPPPPSSGWDMQMGGGCTGLITAPETHQRHPAPALCVSSKLPARGGSAPDLHLVSFYGNRKQLLVGDGEAQVKAGGGLAEGRSHS